jgi:hypothetical protein
MRIKNSTVVSMIALALCCLGASPLLAGESHGTKVKWDIFQYEDFAPPCCAPPFTIAPGGISTSQATSYPAQGAGDNSTITLTGSGTFKLNSGADVTGGGTWKTVNGTTGEVKAGTYQVTSLVFFELGAGTLAGVPGITDETGNLADSVAGLAVLRVHYSDGEDGMLVVSCTIAGPPAVIEGTTATKGVVDYSNPLIPDITTANTLFHILR